MLPLFFIVLLSCFQAKLVTAQLDDDSLPYNYYSSSPITPRPWGPQFESWYPDHAKFLTNVSQGICNLTLRDYRAAYEGHRYSLNGSQILARCYRHEACILSQYGANFQANAQGASIVLGLIPTLLSVIGPNVGEIYLLSIHRPLLATLLSIGSPTYQIARLFEYHHPGNLLNAEDGKLQISVSSTYSIVSLSIIEYLVALMASGLVVYTSIEMGQKTILAWGCTTQFAPLLWAVLTVVPQIFVAGGYLATSWNTDAEQPAPHRRPHRSRTVISQKDVILKKLRALALWLLHALKREVTICAKQELRPGVVEQGPRLMVVLNIAAECMSYVLWAFGTAVFSSLLFLSVHDVFIQIFWPLIISAVLCRTIVIIELAGLRKVRNFSIIPDS
ncbi:hypothetical protein F4819DRAFT_470249 [Hypoxylon fuscum]|nr:hypothetical protein F4819DRAFT_470249 [Hypoxylon fuscum]